MTALAPERPAGRGGARPRPARAALRLAQGLVAAALGLAVVAPAALWLRLREGPIDLAPLVGRLEAAAAEALGGARVSVDGAALTLGAPGDPRPAVRLSGVRAIAADGAPLFAAPRALVELRPLDLLAGRLRPTAVRIEGAEATLRREESGRFRFGVVAADAGGGPDVAAADAAAALAAGAAAAAALDSGEDGAFGALREIALLDARLTYRDEMSGRVWRAENAALAVSRDARGLIATASLTLPEGAHGETRLSAAGSRLPDGGAAMRLSFADASPRDLADQFPALDAFRALDAPLSGEARVAIDGTGRLLGFDGRIEAGSGALLAPDRSVALEGGVFHVALDPETGRYGLDRIALRTAMGAISGAGFLDVTRRPDGSAAGAVAQIEIDALAVTDPALVAAPVAFDGGRIVGRATLDPFAVEVGEAHLSRGALRLDARGRAALGPDGWRGEAEASARDAAIADVLALWPTVAAPGARAWIAENVPAGHVDRIDAFVRIGPDDDALDLTFAFRDATAHYFRPLPPIERGRGWAQLDLKSFALTLAGGSVTAPGGGVVDLAGSSVRIAGLDRPEVEVAAVDAVGSGPARAILEVIDLPPLGFPSRLGIEPAGVAGRAAARAALGFPLLRELRLDEVEVSVEATVADAALSLPALPRRFTAPALALRADVRGFAASGAGRFGDDPVRLSWTETFSPARGAPASRIEAEAAVTAALAADFGIDPGAVFGGRAPAKAVIERFPDGAIGFDATLDLTPATLSVPALGWRKDARWKASGAAAGRLAPDGALRLDRFSITAPGLDAAGSAALTPRGALGRLALERFRLLETTDVALTVEARGGGFDVTARGAALDLTALEGLRDEDRAAGGTGPRIAATVDVGRLTVDEGLTLAPARGEARGGAGRGFAGRVEGRVGGAAVTAALSPEGAATRARLSATDAGALLRAAGFFAGGYGGRLEAEALASPAEGATVEGSVRIDGMRVVRDPGLQKLLARADLAEGERLLRDGGIAFDRIDAAFAIEPGRVTLEDVVAVGPLIGLTASGSIDTARDRIDMDGVFTPLYAVNSLLGNLPIIGGLLTGGEGEGVFGFTFSLSGPAGDPEAAVNPLSILAPGVLRKLFGPADPRVAQPRRDRPND